MSYIYFSAPEDTGFGVAVAAGIASGTWQLSKMTTPLVMSTEGN